MPQIHQTISTTESDHILVESCAETNTLKYLKLNERETLTVNITNRCSFVCWFRRPHFLFWGRRSVSTRFGCVTAVARTEDAEACPAARQVIVGVWISSSVAVAAMLLSGQWLPKKKIKKSTLRALFGHISSVFRRLPLFLACLSGQ